MLIIEKETRDRLRECVRFAKRNGTLESLVEKLNYLRKYAPDSETRCRLYNDWLDKMSFDFIMEVKGESGKWERWFNGGLIYHGPRDGFGSGSGPAFAVTLQPTHGWSIHT